MFICSNSALTHPHPPTHPPTHPPPTTQLINWLFDNEQQEMKHRANDLEEGRKNDKIAQLNKQFRKRAQSDMIEESSSHSSSKHSINSGNGGAYNLSGNDGQDLASFLAKNREMIEKRDLERDGDGQNSDDGKNNDNENDNNSDDGVHVPASMAHFERDNMNRDNDTVYAKSDGRGARDDDNTSTNPIAAVSRQRKQKKGIVGKLLAMFKFIFLVLLVPFRLVLLLTMRSDPDNIFKSKADSMGLEKNLAMSTPIDLARIKGVGKKCKASVNDVVLACAGLAMRNYILKKGKDEFVKVRRAPCCDEIIRSDD